MKKPIFFRKKILIFAVVLAYSHALFSSDGRTVILTGPDGTQIEGVITPNGNFCVGNACVPVDFCEGACDGYLVNSYEPSEDEGLFPAVGSETGNPDTGGFGTGGSNTPPQGGGGRIDNSWEATFGQNTTDIFASGQAALKQSFENMEAEWRAMEAEWHRNWNDVDHLIYGPIEIRPAFDAQKQAEQAVIALIYAYAAITQNMKATRDKIEEVNKETEARLDENLTTKFIVKVEERNKLWKDLEDAKTQTKTKANGVLTALESGTLVTQGSGGFASSPASVGGEKVRRLDKYLGSVQRSLEGEGPLSPQRTAIIDDAKLSNMQADSAYAKGDTETGDALVRIGYALGDAAIALSPIVVAALAPEAAVALAVTGAVAFGKSWYEARTGTRIWDGSPLSEMDRQLAYLDVGMIMLPGLTAAVPKVFKALSGVLTAGRSAEEASAIAKGVNTAEKIFDSAKKSGALTGQEVIEVAQASGKSNNNLWKSSRVNPVSGKHAVDFEHIFSKAHIDGGIMDLGASRADIVNKGSSAIQKADDLGRLVNGSNDILVKMNGHDATIRAFFNGTELSSMNIFKGTSNRVIGNLIDLR